MEMKTNFNILKTIQARRYILELLDEFIYLHNFLLEGKRRKIATFLNYRTNLLTRIISYWNVFLCFLVENAKNETKLKERVE